MSSSDRRAALADALVEIIATRGMDAVSVRSVAAESAVSIGAVQHHFSTKAEMLTYAFSHAVDRTRRRLAAVEPSGDRAADVATVLQQLLPLDGTRRADATVNVAFSAHAATAPALRTIQAGLLREIYAELADALGAGREVHATMLLAVVDGLALHEISAPGVMTPETMTAALDLAIAAALGTEVTPPAGSPGRG